MWSAEKDYLLRYPDSRQINLQYLSARPCAGSNPLHSSSFSLYGIRHMQISPDNAAYKQA